MKTLIQMVVLVCTLCASSFGQGTFWEKKNITFPFSTSVYSPKIVSENVAWMYGDKGSDDGSGWDKDYTNYIISRTTDGGNTWSTETLPFNGKLGDMTSLAVLDDTTAWVSYVESLDNSFGSFSSKVYKTTNGGKTWTQVNVNIGPNWVNIIHFFDKNNGVIIADPSNVDFNIFVTSNGGSTWEKVPILLLPNIINSNEYGLNIYYSGGDKLYFSTSENRIFYSVDKGKFWYVIPSPDVNIEGNFGIARDDKNILYFLTYAGNSSTVYRLGLNDLAWTKLNSPTNVSVNGITAIPGTESLIMISASDNKTRISKDTGNTWSVVDSTDTNGRKRYVSFMNAKTGYCVYRAAGSPSNGILKYIGSPLSGLLSAEKINVDLKIWPNPTIDLITISMEGPKSDNYWILINDVTGNLLYKKEINHIISFSDKVDVQNYPTGTYMVTISNAQGLKSERFIKNE